MDLGNPSPIGDRKRSQNSVYSKSILARQDQLGSYGQNTQQTTDVGRNIPTDRTWSRSAPAGGRDYFRRLTIDRSKTVSRRSSRSVAANSRPETNVSGRSRVSTAVNTSDVSGSSGVTSSRPMTSVTAGRSGTARPFISRDSVMTFCLDDDYDFDNSDTEQEEKKPTPASNKGSDKCRHLYLAACRKLKIVPSSSFLRCLRSKSVRLNHQCITARGIRAICIALVAGLTVTELHLANNDIGDEGLRCVVDMLKDNSIIQVLDVSNNNLRSPGAAMLAGMLTENDSLVELRAAGNRFKAVDAVHFADALTKNTSLRTLDLSHNEIRDDGGKVLGKCLGVNTSLETLDLSWNHLRSVGIAGVAAGLKTNTTLRSLDVSWNGLGSEGAKTLGQALKMNEALEELSLKSCRIGQQALGEFFKLTKTNTTLKTLRLGSNPVTHNGARFVMEFLRDHPSMALETVDMSDVIVSGEFPTLVDTVRSTKPGFRVFHGGVLGGRDAMLRELQLPRVKVRDPLIVLMEYADSNDKRLVDLFSHLDTNNRRRISRHDFRRAIQDTGIPLDRRQIHRLEDVLDTECTGDIDFVDLIDSENKYWKTHKHRGQSGSEPRRGDESHGSGIGDTPTTADSSEAASHRDNEEE